MRDRPTNSDDTIDSRDVIEAIEELENERDALAEMVEEAQAEFNKANATDATEEGRELGDALAHARKELQAWDASDAPAELAALKAFAKQGEDYAPDWEHGEQAIRHDHFKAYAEELAEDLGAVKKDAPWPQSFIDWNAAAEALQQDYTEIEFDGVAYFIR